MVYIPNPADPTQPTGNVDASTADDEFRALKAYVQGIALAAGTFNGVRQCAQDGAKDANGFPTFLTLPGAGGLALDLDATPNPLTVNFAGGQSAVGNNDRVGYLTNDIANVVAGLDTLNTDYIYADYVTQTNWTWGKTLVPPQYGFAYDRTKQALLHFEGSNGAVVTTDDYGNTWTLQGNAHIDTSQAKIGASSLVLDGTTDFAESTSFTSLGGGSWTVEGYFRWNVLPTAATTQILFNFGQNATTFGLLLGLNNTAGTIKTTLSLSSNGTAADILGTSLGAKVAWVINQWYHFAVTYDALAGKYFLYVDGVQDNTFTSALRVAGIARARIGEGNDAALAQMNGWVDEFKVRPYCAYPNGVAFVPSVVAAVVEGDYFDIQAYKMYSTTAASVVAGTNPTLTQKYRLYLGEVDTNAAATTAVRNYAYNGKARTTKTTPLPGVNTFITVSHNIGTTPTSVKFLAECISSDQGYVPGDTTEFFGNISGSGIANETSTNKLSATLATPSGSALVFVGKAGGAIQVGAVNKWTYQLVADRGW